MYHPSGFPLAAVCLCLLQYVGHGVLTRDVYTYEQGDLEYDLDDTAPKKKKKQNPIAGESPCPQFSIQPDLSKLSTNVALGPLHAFKASSKVSGKGPLHLFITGPPYSATTAIYSLVSTSPLTSNLCASRGIACEGSWTLSKHGQIPRDRETRDEPENPADWNKALDVLEQYWDMKQPVLVDKSPVYLRKFSRLYADLTRTGKKVAFIYVVKSPCYVHKGHSKTFLPEIAQEIQNLTQAGARFHIVQSEMLHEDPYRVAKELLEAFPELASVDPSQSGVADAPLVGISKDGVPKARGLPVAEWVQQNGPFPYGMGHTISDVDRLHLQRLGYDRKFWSK